MVRPDGGGGGQQTVVKMTPEAEQTVRRRFESLGELCYGIAEYVPTGYTAVTEACGSFFAQIDPGISAFTASWQTTLVLTSDEAEAIAGNVNRMYVDLTTVDRTLAGG
jgi:hypothetical protein